MQAHSGYVRGIGFTPDGDTAVTVGDDKNIHFWRTALPTTPEEEAEEPTAKHSIVTKVIVSHQSEICVKG